ncbi:MAG: type IX secretion system membrane protein PorP/SprF [Aureispira sp.]|nr:type IX secretion system membrane protein PorP/SprF [Aureispira sp.]
MKKIILSILATVACVWSIDAQQLPVMNHYIYNPYIYNPARTGHKGYGNINLNFKKQWVSMPNSPITGVLSGESPIPGTDMGIGAMLYMDQMHIINKVGGLVSYAYHIPFSKDFPHRLSAGLSLGFLNQRINFDQATVSNESDPFVADQGASGTIFDFNFGLNYQWKDLNVGASLLQGLDNMGISYFDPRENIEFKNRMHILANASYRFALGPKKNFFVEPNVLMRFVPSLPVQVEGNVLFGWNEILWAGLGYRSSNKGNASAFVATLGVEIGKRVFLGYTLDFGVDGNLNASMGTQHEFMLGIKFGRNKVIEDKIKQLDEKITQLEEKQKIINEQVTNNSNNIDSLTTTQQEIKTTLENKVTEIETKLQEQGGKNDNLKQELEEYKSKLDAHNKAIEKNAKDIDELREIVGESKTKYKKLGSFYFEKGSSSTGADGTAIADALKQALENESADITIYLYGNSSVEGDPIKNMQLSTKRAIAVRKALVEAGIKNEIILLPMGAENPMSGDGTAVNKADRRVDVIVEEKGTKKKKKGRL